MHIVRWAKLKSARSFARRSLWIAVAATGLANGSLAQGRGRGSAASNPVPAGPLSQLHFRFLGPNGNRDIAVVGEPGNSLVAYFGAASGGIWKTEDAGAHFAQVFEGQNIDVSSVSALAINRLEHARQGFESSSNIAKEKEAEQLEDRLVNIYATGFSEDSFREPPGLYEELGSLAANIDGAGSDLSPTSTQIEANLDMKRRLTQAQQAVDAFLGQGSENRRQR